MRPTKLVNIESNAKHHNINIMLFEPKKDSGKEAESIRQLVYGKIKYKNNLTILNMGLKSWQKSKKQ